LKKNFLYIAKHSFVYSIGTASLKFGGIVLLPLYTGYFSLEEFGLLSLFLTTITFGTQVLMLGQGDSIVRYNNDAAYFETRKSMFFSLILFMTLLLTIMSVVGITSTYLLRNVFEFLYEYQLHINITIITTAITIINKLFANKLRASEKSFQYTLTHILKLAVIIIFSFYSLLVLNMGIEGVLYAYLLSEIFTFAVLIFPMIKEMEFKYSRQMVLETMKFGIPLSFALIAGTILTTSDRFILNHISGAAELGLYDLGYRVASLLSMIVIMPLTLTLYPVIFKMYKQEGDKDYYVRIHKFMAVILVWIGLGVSLIGKEIIEILAKGADYYPAEGVIPILVVSIVFVGMTWAVSIGMNLSGKTKNIAVNAAICAAINIVLNFLLIPYWGMYAAAYNTVLSLVILYILYTLNANKYYRIDYNHSVLIITLMWFLLYYYVGSLVSFNSFIIDVGIKFALFLSFPIVIFFMKIFDKEEKQFIKRSLRKLNKPSLILSMIKEKSSLNDKD